MTDEQNNKLLEVKNLNTCFYSDSGIIKPSDDVSFEVRKGETLGIVGESGSGKSVTCLSIARLIPDPPGKICSGEIIFNGTDLLKLPLSEMHKFRGKKISYIFQEPMTSLNPILTIKLQMLEVLEKHENIHGKEALDLSINMLTKLGIKDASSRINDYPFNFSGGMLQRVMIGIALLTNNDLLIADEPTTALDVTIANQILNLILDIKKEKKDMSMILVTHNLTVVKKMCNRVIIMYAGKIQETAPVKDFFENPQHPYTKALIKCIKNPLNKGKRLEIIKGQVPDLSNLPKGCKFHPRCEIASDKCKCDEPQLKDFGNGHFVRCFRDEN